ncbi:MAG: NuoM family protein [Acidobacteriota bacterium]
MPELTLSALIGLPLIGGGLAALLGRWRAAAARWVSLLASLLTLALSVGLWLTLGEAGIGVEGPMLEQRLPWIPRFGIEFHLALDGLSLLFVVLTGCLACIGVLVSWREIDRGVGAHYFCILATVAGIMGVFLAYDLFLFYFFWELMLVPMIFLIGVWGHERRIAAAIKFTLFTMVSGLLLLVAILGLYAAHGAATGVYTMDYTRLLHTQLPLPTARWLFLGFLAAFAVKLPIFPFHTWLPDAHTEAPTAGSVLLAGLLLKTGGYGLIRFGVPLFPEAAALLAAPLAILAVIGIFYGAVLAFAQTDLKRMIAYSSVSHMGFVVLGVAAWGLTTLQGAVVQMIAHGVATGALFAVAGMLQERLHTREFSELGGLWSQVPRLSALALLFALASLGLPGMGNFIGEFLVLLGSFPLNPALVATATAGIVLAAVVSLALMQRAFFGPEPEAPATAMADLSPRETLVLGTLALLILLLGIVPQPVLQTAERPLAQLVAADVRFNPADPEMAPPDRSLTALTRAPADPAEPLFPDLLVARRAARDRAAPAAAATTFPLKEQQ